MCSFSGGKRATAASSVIAIAEYCAPACFHLPHSHCNCAFVCCKLSQTAAWPECKNSCNQSRKFHCCQSFPCLCFLSCSILQSGIWSQPRQGPGFQSSWKHLKHPLKMPWCIGGQQPSPAPTKSCAAFEAWDSAGIFEVSLLLIYTDSVIETGCIS